MTTTNPPEKSSFQNRGSTCLIPTLCIHVRHFAQEKKKYNFVCQELPGFCSYLNWPSCHVVDATNLSRRLQLLTFRFLQRNETYDSFFLGSSDVREDFKRECVRFSRDLCLSLLFRWRRKRKQDPILVEKLYFLNSLSFYRRAPGGAKWEEEAEGSITPRALLHQDFAREKLLVAARSCYSLQCKSRLFYLLSWLWDLLFSPAANSIHILVYYSNE